MAIEGEVDFLIKSYQVKLFKQTILALTLCLGSFSAFSQDTGIIKFFVEVDNGYFEIEVNDTMLLKRYKDTLPVGTYSAKVWSPGYVTTPIEFTVYKDKVTEKHVEMAKNNNYIQYEQDYKVYRNQFHKQFTVPLSVTIATALTTGVFMVNAYDTKKKITNDIDLYHKSPSTLEIDDLKLRIADNNRRYNRQRTAYFIGGGFTLAFIGGTIWSYMNFNKNYTEPTFIKDSPFKDKYSFNITPYGCSFTLKI